MTKISYYTLNKWFYRKNGFMENLDKRFINKILENFEKFRKYLKFLNFILYRMLFHLNKIHK